MQLFAYNLAGSELLIWVGVRGISESQSLEALTSAISFKIANKVTQPANAKPAFEPLGGVYSRNYRAIFIFDWPETSERFTIEIRCHGKTIDLTSKRPPKSLPSLGEGNFRFLLSSCYYQSNDKNSPNFSSLVKENINPPPDFTFLAGDQVYLDLPSHENLPKEENELTQALEEKYLTNWFPCEPLQSPLFEQSNLSHVLKNGPVLCIPDDHEYWNNYPYKQVQLNNTYFKKDKQRWANQAKELYQQYQMAPALKDGFFRMDIEPLCMLFFDGRRFREEDSKMFNDESFLAIDQWSKSLLQKKENGVLAVGLLCSGQVLLIEKPSEWEHRMTDAEMPNYEDDYGKLMTVLSNLINKGIPIIYLTGDVHWGRIIEGKNRVGDTMFYEIIASPSRLQDFIFKDQFNSIKNKYSADSSIRDLPKHPSPPPEKLSNFKFANLDFYIKHQQRGDHVALLNFSTNSRSIDLTVEYICTDVDPRKRRDNTRTIKLNKITSYN